jgi:hypothetical protein
MQKSFFRFAAMTCCIAAGMYLGVAQAQTLGGPPDRTAALIAQALPQATLDALQTAIDDKDTAAILNLLNSTPKDQRGPMATMLLAAAQGAQAVDSQFAATLAALAFMSGALTSAQLAMAIAVIRSAPGGLAIVNTLVSTNLTGGFGLTTNTAGLFNFNLVITENQNQTQGSPN